MKIIEKFVANDGKQFNTKKECEDYEVILNQIEIALKDLPKKNFSSDEGYLKLPIGTYDKLEKLLVRLSNEWFKTNDFTCFNYVLGRYIDDSDMKALRQLSYKLMCIRDNKEYGQPYFANNSDKAQNIQLN
jgi:hypothetical protein